MRPRPTLDHNLERQAVQGVGVCFPAGFGERANERDPAIAGGLELGRKAAHHRRHLGIVDVLEAIDVQPGAPVARLGPDATAIGEYRPPGEIDRKSSLGVQQMPLNLFAG